jgi:flagellar biosynthesis/type III secretory pathway protein FliH
MIPATEGKARRTRAGAERILEEALRRKYADGEAEGYGAGYETGRYDGYAAGFADGQDEMRDSWDGNALRRAFYAGFQAGDRNAEERHRLSLNFDWRVYPA